MALIRESLVRPLVEANERHVAEIKKLSHDNGELTAELRIVKQRLEAMEVTQAARDAARLAESPPAAEINTRPETAPQAAQEPSPILDRNTLQPVDTQTKKGFWARLFGG